MKNGIYNWSFSRLMLYERCAFAFKLKAIDRLPELPREPGNPLERGNRVHDGMEMYVKGQAPSIPREATHFSKLADHLRVLHDAHMVSAEETWYFDEQWEPTEKGNLWLIALLDINVRDEANKHSIVLDWKTGKMGYKLIEHAQQGQLYAALAAIRQPWAEKITVEFAYVDQNDMTQRTYSREAALSFIGPFQKRIEVMYNDKIFRPRPSAMNCKWCAFGITDKVGTGACPFAYKG